MRVWVDLANSPHPLLFAPVARRLEEDGHEVLVTARVHAQTAELAVERWPEVALLGGPSPAGRAGKLAAMRHRIAELRRWGAEHRPDVALSHNSYAQLMAARRLGIPAVTTMDYEHQPANHLAFRLARTVAVPEILPARTLRRQGATEAKVVRYPGLKEELYLGDFEPDGRVLARLGLAVRPHALVVVRTAPHGALYHRRANPLLADALVFLSQQPGVVCVALCRTTEDRLAIQALRLPNCLLPSSAVDSRSLLFQADAMIGGGGTMTREAALMGIPTWTAFAGAPPAVDAWLEGRGRLRRLSDPRQLAGLGPRRGDPTTPEQLRQRAAAIEQVLVSATVSAAGLRLGAGGRAA